MQAGNPREYEGFVLSEKVRAPSYDFCLDWMRGTSGAHASYDVWARGNFTRRLLHHRAVGVEPLVVQVANVPEMRWAYRRLALLGHPVDLIYTGHLRPSGRILHLFPWESTHDCGWGYIAALDPVTVKGRKWFTVLGTARLMPEEVLGWVVKEIPTAFSQGEVFVAPAELVGIDPAATQAQVEVLSDVAGGRAVIPENYAAASTLMELHLPYIDGMSPDDFHKLLSEHAEELREFRAAFGDLMRRTGDLSSARSRLESEIAELTRAARHEQLRLLVSRCKGSLLTFPVAMAALAAAGAAYASDPFAGAAVVGAAGKALADLWRESRQQAGDTCPHPYRILWRLGAEKGSREPQTAHGEWPQRQPVTDDALPPCHWLCPPTNGLAYLGVRR